MTTTRHPIFLIGGAVRDEIMGIDSKDLDFVVVMPDTFASADEAFAQMRSDLIADGFRIFTENPEFFTIRAKFPKGDPRERQDGDFVMARIDGPSSDGRHPDFVTVGTLFDDQRRRDFTVNAIAKAEDGTIIDPFDGRADIATKTLRCVGEASERFAEDSLRVLRAIRFAITKGFTLDSGILKAFTDPTLPERLVSVSAERKREELNKGFRHGDTLEGLAAKEMDAAMRANTLATLDMLASIPKPLRDAVFEAGNLRLTATMKK